MDKKVFEGEIDTYVDCDEDFNDIYCVGNELYNFLDEYSDKHVRITIEELDDKPKDGE